MFYVDDPDLDDHYSLRSKEKMSIKIKISDNLNLYIDKSYLLTYKDDGKQTSKSKDNIIFDDVIDNFTELVKNHHTVYYDGNKYLRRLYSCILENKKNYVELELNLIIYFRNIHNKNKKMEYLYP